MAGNQVCEQSIPEVPERMFPTTWVFSKRQALQRMSMFRNLGSIHSHGTVTK